MTTNRTDKQSLIPTLGHGGSEMGKCHDTKSSKRSSIANNKRSGRLVKGLAIDDEATHPERRVNDDHDSSQSESESRSVEDLRGDSGAKSSSTKRVTTRSKGGATRRKDGNGRWQATLEYGRTRDGKRIRKVFYGKTKAEALAKRDRAKAAMIYGVVDLNDSTTFLEFATIFLRDTAGLTCKPTTVTGYEDLLKHHAYPRIGHLRLLKIRAADIDNLMTEMKYSGLSVGTLKAVRRVVSTVLAHAERNDLIPSNPVRKTKVPKLMDGDKYRKPVPYTEGQIEILLKLLPTSQYGTVWKFILWTGMRRGEALGLKWGDLIEEEGQWSADVSKQLQEARVNSRDGVSTVSRTVASPKTKTSSRVVPLERALVRELQELRKSMVKRGIWAKEEDFIFQTAGGKPYYPSNVSNAWRKFLVKNNLRHIQLHGLRHTFATISLSQGSPLESVSQIMGHSSLQITKDLYAKNVPGLSRRATDAMTKVMDPTQFVGEGKDFNQTRVRGVNDWNGDA